MGRQKCLKSWITPLYFQSRFCSLAIRLLIQAGSFPILLSNTKKAQKIFLDTILCPLVLFVLLNHGRNSGPQLSVKLAFFESQNFGKLLPGGSCCTLVHWVSSLEKLSKNLCLNTNQDKDIHWLENVQKVWFSLSSAMNTHNLTPDHISGWLAVTRILATPL